MQLILSAKEWVNSVILWIQSPGNSAAILPSPIRDMPNKEQRTGLMSINY